MKIKTDKTGALLWNIEKIVSKGDYNYAIVGGHPNRTKNNYVLVHRIVMENHLGRVLNTNEVVHHINEDKKDNRIENLQLMTTTEHCAHHAALAGKTMLLLNCPGCNSVFSRQKNQTHVSKKGLFTCCSPQCRGRFSRMLQLQGRTEQVDNAISGNILLEYNSRDNSEET